MNFKIRTRSVGQYYVQIDAEFENASFDCGLHDEKEIEEAISQLQEALNDLKNCHR